MQIFIRRVTIPTQYTAYFTSKGWTATIRERDMSDELIISTPNYVSAYEVTGVLDEFFSTYPDTGLEKDFQSQLKRNKIIYITPQEKQIALQKNEAIKQFILSFDQTIQTYINLGKKFCFFQQNGDRKTEINKLRTEINTLYKSNKFTYDKLAVLINKARVATIESHKKNSWSAWIGLTDSRLATVLSQALDRLVSEGHLKNARLQEIKNPPVNAPVATPYVSLSLTE